MLFSCAKLRSGFCKDDPETWKRLSETETGRYYDAYLPCTTSTCNGYVQVEIQKITPDETVRVAVDRYGLPPDPVIFTKQLLRNRQNCNLAKL